MPCKEENNRISEVVKVLMPLRTLWNNIRLQQQQSVKSIKNIKKLLERNALYIIHIAAETKLTKTLYFAYKNAKLATVFCDYKFNLFSSIFEAVLLIRIRKTLFVHEDPDLQH